MLNLVPAAAGICSVRWGRLWPKPLGKCYMPGLPAIRAPKATKAAFGHYARLDKAAVTSGMPTGSWGLSAAPGPAVPEYLTQCKGLSAISEALPVNPCCVEAKNACQIIRQRKSTFVSRRLPAARRGALAARMEKSGKAAAAGYVQSDSATSARAA